MSNQAATKTNYLATRLQGLGLSEKDIEVSACWRDNKIPQKMNYFREKEGNIQILYLDPFGFVQEYDSKGKLKQFTRERIAEKINGQRYTQPTGSGIFPFITPTIIEKVKTKSKIDTLFIVEGEFKAYAGDKLLGLDIIAIPGIQSFVEKRVNELHRDIQDIIKVCQVKTIILLFDADCLDISENFENDLYNRPFSFYNSIKRLKEHCKPLNIDLYFTHIKSEYSKIAKGLDDLIVYSKTDKQKLKKELYQYTTTNKEYLECLNISDNSINQLNSYFGLSNVNEFYIKHEKVIDEKEFTWKSNKYYFDVDNKKLRVSWYGEASHFMRVGFSYYKLVNLINAQKDTEETILEWSPSEINRDYGNNKEFFRQIPKYDVFCNIPDHTDNYQRIVIIERNGLKTIAYNRYYKLDHELKEGSFPIIEKFLQHIAESTNLKGESLYPFLLDWLQLCYKEPTQRLPVLCLVSKERGTGKSTFLEFLRLVFKENATILDNERFTGKFTSHYVTKLIISVDESFIPIEQKQMKERIKNLATGKRQWLEAKGRNAQEIDFFGKLVLCSNDENNFMQIDTDENRHCVLKINPLKLDDPDLLDKMKGEVPYFLYFLNNRKLKYSSKDSRAWFEPNVYKTKAVLNVMERTKSRLEREIEMFMEEIFLITELSTIELTAKDISITINLSLSYKTSPVSIRDYFNEKGYKPIEFKRYTIYDANGNENGSKPGTPYLFLREDWVKTETKKQF